MGVFEALPLGATDKRDPPQLRFAAPPRDWGGSHRAGGGGGGGVRKFGMGGLGGRRPDPGLLVPDASRQEAEANFETRTVLRWHFQT